MLAEAAARRGLAVETLPTSRRGSAHYYGGPLFGAGQVDALGLALLEPADDWLTSLPEAFRGREIRDSTLGEARRSTRPAFVKPPSDKGFPAAVYADGGRLPPLRELSPDTPVQTSEVVTWVAEYRLFVLDGTVRTGSRYARFGRLDVAPLGGGRHERAVRGFATELLAECGAGLPSAVVVDVGLLTRADGADETWAVVEANMAWFSHSYAADPDGVLDVVLRSAGPRDRLADRDRPFCRHLMSTVGPPSTVDGPSSVGHSSAVDGPSTVGRRI
ncbi:ATP-grasp domain-containing protein [Kitasatospora paranensis]|uniref:ATP-grasp domain-containing protein n=1 Tax=Kitasatospora paranensis TaxID=258053 RepID=A0ABW2FWL4_9ACTN